MGVLYLFEIHYMIMTIWVLVSSTIYIYTKKTLYRLVMEAVFNCLCS